MFKIVQTLLIIALSVNLLQPVPTAIEPVAALETIENYGFSPLDYEYEEITVVENEVELVAEPEPEPEPAPRFTEEEIFLIAWCMMGEAEGESELGKRLVIDVILNRIDSPKFANTAHDVIYAKGQFVAMLTSRKDRCKDKVTEEMMQLVREEIESRTNDKVLYFRTKHYHKWGTPELQVGCHYFSS
jgi:N-acetylmuramoyl-L-alanine amidase